MEEQIKIIKSYNKEENSIIIISHDNPDVDAVLSSTLLQLILKKHDIHSTICYRTGISNDTNKILEENNLIKPENYLKIIPENAKLILTDWFSVPDNNNEIIAIFDHHPTTQELNVPIVFEEEYTSCTKLVYDLFKEDIEQYPEFLKRQIEYNVLYSLFLDSNSLKSTRTNKNDLPWIDEIIKKYNYDREHLTRVGYCLTNLSLPIKQLARNGEKSYILPNGKTAYISYIIVMNYNRKLDNAIAIEMENIRREKDFDYSWYLICDLNKDTTYIYKLSKEDNGVGVWEICNSNLSRAKDIYPMLEELNQI